MNLKFLYTTGIAIIASAFIFSCSNDTTSTYSDNTETEEAMSKMDSSKLALRDFIVEAASDGTMEIKLARMAYSRTEILALKEMTADIIEDRQIAQDQLEDVAHAFGWKIPSKLKADHQDKIDQMKDVAKGDFEEMYLNHIIEDHKKDIDDYMDAFEKGEETYSDSNTKKLLKWINETIYTIEEHMEEAKEIKKQMMNS